MEINRAKTMQECPYCGEKIKIGAVKCRYCREYLNTNSEDPSSISQTKTETKGVSRLSPRKYLAIFPIGLYILSLIVVFGIYNGIYDAPKDEPGTDSGYVKPIEEYNRLENGEVISRDRNLLYGNGELKIENGSDNDAIFKLVRTNKKESIFTVYVRSNDSYTIRDIADGNYDFIVGTGRDYDSSAEKFNLSNSFYKFEGPSRYETTETEYTIFTITLHSIPGGNALTYGIPQEEFENY